MESVIETRAPERTVPAPMAWVSCARCRDLHPVADVLAFAPLCPPCRGVPARRLRTGRIPR